MSQPAPKFDLDCVCFLQGEYEVVRMHTKKLPEVILHYIMKRYVKHNRNTIWVYASKT